MEKQGCCSKGKMRWLFSHHKGAHMKKHHVEILAPAGSYESMVAAVNAGADAVYIGGSRFGARAYANNLDEEAMVKAIDFVHLHGRKLYMTVNTLVKETELGELFGYLTPYYEVGLDAVIVQDLGVFTFIREHFPDLPIHVSTQMTVTGKYGAAMLKEMGAVRVVPARELSLKEIRSIYEETGMEIETFVHGALCYGYSGQCLFSSLIGGRSGNRGRCAQTCRLPFDVLRDGRTVNNKNEKYVLSLKDLCTLDVLPDILEAGVCSLKIEGRMKSPRYTAGVVSIYRKYLNLYLKEGRAGYRVEEKDKKTLLELFDRGGQSQGYYKEHNGRDMVVLKEKPEFREGNKALFDYLDQTFVEAVKKEPVRGFAHFEAGKPAALSLNYVNPAAAIDGPFQTQEENDSRFRRKAANAKELVAVWYADLVEEAKNAPMDEARIRKQLMKTGDLPFEFEKLEITIKGNVFVPVQTLNKLRREAFKNLAEAILTQSRRTSDILKTSMGKTELLFENKEAGVREFSAYVSRTEQFEAALGQFAEWIQEMDPVRSWRFSVYLASETFGPGVWKTITARCHEAGIFCYLMLPRIFRAEAEDYFLSHLRELKDADFDAVGIGSMEEPEFLRRYYPEIPMYFDQGMYAMNHISRRTLSAMGASRYTVPVELNRREMEETGVSGELILYGRLPMMISAQCIQKTTGGCTKKPDILWLRDRKGKEFPAENQCRFCYNTIYNASPLSLLGLSGEVSRLDPPVLRLNFTLENQKETREVLEAFYMEFVKGEMKAAPRGDFTRGHFRRGVE